MEHQSVTAWVANSLGVGAIVATVVGWTPSVAAIIALVWYCIQIKESDTTQKWLARRRQQKLARLRDEVRRLESELPPAG